MRKEFFILLVLVLNGCLFATAGFAQTADEYFKSGFAAYSQGNLTAAVSDFSKAIEKNPDFAEAYNNRGLVYAKQRDFIQAIADYTKAIALNPSFSAAYNNRGLAYHNRGTVYGNQENFNQAVSDYNQAVKIDPNYAQAYYNRGFTYFMTKDYDKAWSDVHQAEGLGMAINPEFITSLKDASGRDK
jgi:tetratricopeptide (TPR) repeat protein